VGKNRVNYASVITIFARPILSTGIIRNWLQKKLVTITGMNVAGFCIKINPGGFG
jgi:hypothetical protein